MTKNEKPRQPAERKKDPVDEATKILAGESLRTSAVLLGNVQNGSDEWHAIRSTGIGGSEVAAIVGCSRWESAFTLWAKKTGRIEVEKFAPSEAAEWGNRLEPVILDKFEDEHPEFEIIRDVGTWHHKDRRWQIANPDAIAIEKNTNEPIIIEVKTAQYEDDWSDGPPVYYMTQVQWYLQTFGYSKAIFAVLFHGNKYEEHVVEASEFEQSVNLELVERFKHYVDDDIEPDFDGSKSTLETVRKMHPDIDPELNMELGTLGDEYLAALRAAIEADKNFHYAKSRVMMEMGIAKTGTLNGTVIVTRQARGNGTPFLVNKKGIS